MHEFLEFTVSGLATAAIYAIAASGLVLTYATTGIFNFAHGAVGMLAAFVYWQLHYGWGWSAPISVIVCLIVLGPLFGAFLDVAIMRRLEGAPEATRLVVTISLLVALLGLSLWIWSPQVGRQLYPFFRGEGITIAGIGISGQEVTCVLVAVLLAIGLRFFLYSTRVGIALRAGVDDRSLARLNGANPDRGSMLAWAIGVSLAALSGILIAPTVSLSAIPLTLLIVNAYAAAVFGKLRSIPLTFLGALILGLVGEYVPDYLQSSSANQYLQGMYLSIPVIVLFVVLLAMPNSRLRGHVVARGREIVPRPTRVGAGVFLVAIVVVAAMVGSVVSGSDLKVSISVFGLGIIGLSLVPLLGFAGQVSLCQLTLGGIGAIVMGHLGTHGNPLGLLAAAVITGAIGILIALPALRLSGIYFALATAAFAVAMDQWVFVLPTFSWFGHSFTIFNSDALAVQLPKILGLQATSNYGQFLFMAVAFSVCGLVVIAVRRSTFGGRLLAMKDSPAACATLGMNITRTKVTVFALSSAMAGVGGALYAGSQQIVGSSLFTFATGLPLLLVVVVAGVGTVGGGLAAGVFMGSPIFGDLFHNLPELPTVLAGLAGIGLGRDPNGFLIRMRHEWMPIWTRPRRLVEVGGLLVGLWILRIGGVIGNWPYAVASLAVVVLTPLALQGLARGRRAVPARRSPDGADAGTAMNGAGALTAASSGSIGVTAEARSDGAP